MPYNNMVGPNGTWPEEHTKELIRLAGHGVSYRAIAATLNEKFGTNYNRNATIGKVNRLGLKKAPADWQPQQISTKPKAPKPKPKRIVTFGNAKATRVYTSVQVEQYKLRCVDIEPRNLDLADLGANDCRYPYGDGPMLFCGHPKMDGSSYCAPHHFLCWEPPRRLVDKRFARTAA